MSSSSGREWPSTTLDKVDNDDRFSKKSLKKSEKCFSKNLLWTFSKTEEFQIPKKFRNNLKEVIKRGTSMILKFKWCERKRNSLRKKSLIQSLCPVSRIRFSKSGVKTDLPISIKYQLQSILMYVTPTQISRLKDPYPISDKNDVALLHWRNRLKNHAKFFRDQNGFWNMLAAMDSDRILVSFYGFKSFNKVQNFKNQYLQDF